MTVTEYHITCFLKQVLPTFQPPNNLACILISNFVSGMNTDTYMPYTRYIPKEVPLTCSYKNVLPKADNCATHYLYIVFCSLSKSLLECQLQHGHINSLCVRLIFAVKSNSVTETEFEALHICFAHLNPRDERVISINCINHSLSQ